MTLTEQDNNSNRAELLNKLHSRMNQRKMGRMNKNHKEHTMNQMKQKIVGDNKEMGDVFDKVVAKTKKRAKKKPKKGIGLSDQDVLKNNLEKDLSNLMN